MKRQRLSLIKLQEEAVAAILAATPYASLRRYTFLNRKAQVMRGIYRKYIQGMTALEIPEAQHRILWQDVCDIATLEERAGE